MWQQSVGWISTVELLDSAITASENSFIFHFLSKKHHQS